MADDERLGETRARVRRLISSWSAVPAFSCDRHLTVIAANTAAAALTPGFAEGSNLARFTFLEPGLDRDHAEYGAAAEQVASLLKHSLAEHEGDAVFRRLLGDLSVLSGEFASVWAEDLRPAATSGTVRFPRTAIGDLRLIYQVLQVPGDSEDLVFVWGAADADSERALTRAAGSLAG